MAPRTVWGRLITIVYALAGIPLMLVYLSTVGDVLARSFRRLYGRLCRPRNCTRKQQPPPPPPPVGGIMSKTYRYDNHVDSKSSNYYSASRESSCDDLGTRGTSSAILLDCGSEGLLHATTSSTAALQVWQPLSHATRVTPENCTPVLGSYVRLRRTILNFFDGLIVA